MTLSAPSSTLRTAPTKRNSSLFLQVLQNFITSVANTQTHTPILQSRTLALSLACRLSLRLLGRIVASASSRAGRASTAAERRKGERGADTALTTTRRGEGDHTQIVSHKHLRTNWRTRAGRSSRGSRLKPSECRGLQCYSHTTNTNTNNNCCIIITAVPVSARRS